jgi:hypothetical protein
VAQLGAHAETAPTPALPELANVPWRERQNPRQLKRWGRLWTLWIAAITVQFVVGGAALLIIAPITAPVALACFAHAWIIPELYAFRGASVVRPKGTRHIARGVAVRAWAEGSPRQEGLTPSDGEPAAQGLLADLLGHEPRELQRKTGLALEPGSLGIWLVGEAGALLVNAGGRRVHCFCVRTTDPDLPPSDRIAHLLLALRSDEIGFATVANHAYSGAAWRIRRRLPKPMRPALDAARQAAKQLDQ